jgi:hypothetical protein
MHQFALSGFLQKGEPILDTHILKSERGRWMLATRHERPVLDEGMKEDQQ